MNSRIGKLPRVNPFSSRFVTPGAISFRFSRADGFAELVRRLEANGGWGQIVGPHGSGKSTLLASLLPKLMGWHLRHVRLNVSERELPGWVWQVPLPQSLLVVDGFEQLGILTRWQLKRHCRRHGSGLLVTVHQSMGLPALYRTDLTAGMASELIAGLVPSGGERVLEGFDVAARLRHNRGNLREVLFELYDRWSVAECGL